LIDLFPGLLIIYSLSTVYDYVFENMGYHNLVSGNYIKDVGGVAVVVKQDYIV